MKRHWEVDELIEHWTLLPSEEALLENKIGANRLGFAVLLKFFQLEGRFPTEKSDVPKPVIVYLAKQLSIPWEEYHAYDWQGRSIKYHRAQIRSFLDFREATASDETEMINWLVEQVLAHEQDIEHLSALVFQQFRSIHIEPPTNQQTLRLIRSAIRKYETNFFSNTLQKLSDLTKTQIDALLSQTTTTDSEENINPQDSQQSCDFSDLKADPGRVGLESILGFELLPRLKRIHSQKLYRPSAGNSSAYPNLQLILTRVSSSNLV